MQNGWQKFAQGLEATAPLLLSMGQGLRSGNGVSAAVPRGLAAMMELKKERDEERQRKEDMGLLGGMMGGGMTSTQGGPVPSPSYGGAGQGQRNQALQTYGGPTNQAANALNVDFGQYEQQYGLPQGYLERVAQVESSMNPNAQNPNSSAGGLFQFIDSTAQQYGLADRMDPVASTDAAARLARDNAAHLTRVLGRQPTAGELYLAHQQGAGGAAKMLSNPNARAVDVVGADAVRLNGGDANMTAGQFASKWVSKIDGQGGSQPGVMSAQGQPQQAGGMDQGRLMRILQSEHISPAVKQYALQRYEQANPQPMTEMERLQLEQARLQTEQMQNPQPKTTDDITEFEYARRNGYQGTFQDFVNGPADPSSAEAKIQRIRDAFGVDQQTAVGIVDGTLKVSRDPVDDTIIVTNLANGESYRPQMPDVEQPAPSAPTQSAPDDSGLGFPAGVGGDASNAFGLEGILKGAVNAGADFVGAGAPFEDVRETQSDFDVLSESLINDVASAYNRQPPSWLLQNIRELTPQTGGFQGAGSAQSKLGALRRNFENELRITDEQLGRRMSPAERNELLSRRTGLEAAISKVDSYLGRFGGGGEKQQTSSGVTWSIEE